MGTPTRITTIRMTTRWAPCGSKTTTGPGAIGVTNADVRSTSTSATMTTLPENPTSSPPTCVCDGRPRIARRSRHDAPEPQAHESDPLSCGFFQGRVDGSIHETAGGSGNLPNGNSKKNGKVKSNFHGGRGGSKGGSPAARSPTGHAPQMAPLQARTGSSAGVAMSRFDCPVLVLSTRVLAGGGLRLGLSAARATLPFLPQKRCSLDLPFPDPSSRGTGSIADIG